MKKFSLIVMSILYMLAGMNHFRAPDFYMKMMPPYLPEHHLLILVSGVCEVLLGLMLLFRSSRRLAAWGIILLLIAVFPANIYMYQHANDYGASPSVLLLRLPLQFVLMAWAYVYTRQSV